MKYPNIDAMLEEFKEKIKLVTEVRKYSGISIGCTYDEKTNKENVIKEIKQICKSLKLPSYTINTSKLDSKELILEFPDFIPEYTETEIIFMYKLNANWLIENALKNDLQHKLTKEIFINGAGIYIKHMANMFYRSNINKYKLTFEEFFTVDLEKQLYPIYLAVLDDIFTV